MLGTFGTYQHFADPPLEGVGDDGGKRFTLSFERETARASLVGPENTFLDPPRPFAIEFLIHRDREANAAVIEIQGKKILLKAGQWSRWTQIHFDLPCYYLKTPRGICRFYLQEVAPHFRLYVSPINLDPSAPEQKMSEPASFVEDVSKRLGLFSTTGFQEDYSARKNKVFVDDEFLKQAGMVLEERLALFDYALDDYDGGLLFFYFSSSDLQSHMFWWDSDERHPVRSDGEAKRYFGHVQRLYRRLDEVVGGLMDRFGGGATIIVMSDHGFANFGRQFNLNSWLRDFGYLGPRECTSVLRDVDWSVTYAYGLGINGLYLNLKGRERDGIVEPGEKAEELLAELKERLEAVTDVNGEPVIRTAYRADQVYSGSATALAPDLIVGYRRGYRASWATCLGDLTDEVLLDNDSAWSADHCADALEVPGVLFCNRPFRAGSPALVDVAPSILAEFGLPTPATMSGKSIFS
jgi:predicted AlkP superfamily phosphohydrolase/phosphomutase